MKLDLLPSRVGLAAIVLGCAAAILYVVMVAITLAHIEAVSGLAPLDLRPTGYSAEDVVALFEALGEDGRRYYLTRQLPLDMLYPCLLALTLICTMQWLGLRLSHRNLVRFSCVTAVATALFDYCENFGIAVMILNWPNLPDGLVQLSSAASIAKSALTVLTLTLLAVLFGLWLVHRAKTTRH